VSPLSTKVVLVTSAMSILMTGAVIGDRVRVQRSQGVQIPVAPSKPGLIQEGKDVMLVLVASSDCGASRMPSLKPDFLRIHRALLSRTSGTDSTIRTLGISVDGQPRDGVQFLTAVFPFDEVAAGRSWMNSGALTYLWRSHPGPSAVPQVLLVARTIRQYSGAALDVSDDEVIERAVGVSAIHRLAEDLASHGRIEARTPTLVR